MLFHVFVTPGHPKKTKGRRLPESSCQLFPAKDELITPTCFTLPPDHEPVEKACLKGPNLNIIKANRHVLFYHFRDKSSGGQQGGWICAPMVGPIVYRKRQ